MDVSGISLNVSTFEERQRHLSFQRSLYTFYLIQVLVCLSWCIVVVCNMDSIGKFLTDWWQLGQIAQILAILIIIQTLFTKITRNSPLNWILYISFIILFSYSYSWIVAEDTYLYAYFAIWLIFCIAATYQFYSWSTTEHQKAYNTILLMSGPLAVVYAAFLIGSEATYFQMIQILLGCLLFGFYLNWDIRRMVRGNLYTFEKKDYVSGSISLWAETLVVFVRFIEQAFRSCCMKDRQ